MLQFNLSVSETNLILKALGRLPFDEVIVLINKIRTEGDKQVKENEEKSKIVKS